MFRPETLTVNPSRWMQGFILLSHLLSLCALGLTTLPSWVYLFLIGAVLAHGWFSLRRYGWLLHPESVRELHWDEEQWSIRLFNGRQQAVTPCASSMLAGFMTLAHFEAVEGGKRFAVPLLPDSAAVDEIRRLRVQLQFSATALSRKNRPS